MSIRKVKIKVKADKVREVLDELDLVRFGETEIEVLLGDTERAVEALKKSENIIEFSFLSDEVAEEVSEELGFYIPEPPAIETPKYLVGFNELATYIEAYWRYNRSNGYFGKTLDDIYYEVASSPLSLDHVALKAILESYYADKLEAAVPDVLDKLEKHKKDIAVQNSLTTVAVMLFRK